MISGQGGEGRQGKAGRGRKARETWSDCEGLLEKPVARSSLMGSSFDQRCESSPHVLPM